MLTLPGEMKTEEMKKLFVGGIAKDATDEEFKEYFETQCGGEVSDAVIIRKDNDKKNHFGFVTFAESELIDNLLLKKAELSFKGKSLDVNRAVPKSNTSEGAHSKTKKLFIANVPKTGVSDDDLKAYFEKRHPKEFGTIESVQLIKVKDKEGNKTEENKGFGFVTVSSEDMADKMAIQHASFEFGGRKIELKKYHLQVEKVVVVDVVGVGVVLLVVVLSLVVVMEDMAVMEAMVGSGITVDTAVMVIIMADMVLVMEVMVVDMDKHHVAKVVEVSDTPHIESCICSSCS